MVRFSTHTQEILLFTETSKPALRPAHPQSVRTGDSVFGAERVGREDNN